MPLWRACAERGLPVIVQNGVPADVRALVEAVPDLAVVFAHFCGAGFGPEADYQQRLAIVASSPNVYTDTGALAHRQRYPFAQAKVTLQRALERIRAEDILWGSDYPRPGLVADASYKQQLEFVTVECDFMSAVQRDRILGGTALAIYPWGAV
jgi:predicted TIM-barrel fold metal-dependent hydrolase